MKTEERWRWRIKWCGKWTITSHHAAETQIRIEHPEATRIEGTRIEQQVPETHEERLTAMYESPGAGHNRS